ncbi:putative metallo-beta-lactamase, ribonuclease Z/Hydroxyacylglutathione hydrolase [Septoria linicola]|nr:putative metallo-beta-lactamase, ribonuclease Z/Hydroxyacylglutathione hydrolase [Septoria linicola]
MSSQPQPKQAPPIGLPKGSTVCEVSIINTTCDLVVPPITLLEPHIEGHELLNLPTYAFLVTHASGAQVLFDLGCRADWENLVPNVSEVVAQRVPGLRVQTEVPDILREGGVQVDKIKALILSHWHFDHSGNISRLAPSTDLIVGPGFKAAFEPGFPQSSASVFYEEDFKGRNVIEPSFSDDLKIGRYQAHDYFGDGSLYILNVPGHTTGHISALVRTTPDSAIFMGGDVCHFTGVIRPTEFLPMPDPLPQATVLDKRFQHPCPCITFTACHPNQAESRTAPFYRCSSDKDHSWYDDPKTAMESIRKLFEFDADPNVMVVIAHDAAPLDVLPFFPDGNINDWQEKGYKEKMHWHFVNELPVDGKIGRDTLTDGLYRDGKRVKTLTGEAV